MLYIVFLLLVCFNGIFAMETPEQSHLAAQLEKLNQEIAKFGNSPKPKSAQEIAAFSLKMANETSTLFQQQHKANSDAQDRGLASVDKLIKEKKQKDEQSTAIGSALEHATTPDEFDAIINQMVATPSLQKQ